MANYGKCPLCKTQLVHAPGLAIYCPKKDCPTGTDISIYEAKKLAKLKPKFGCKTCRYKHPNLYAGWVCSHPKGTFIQIKRFFECSRVGYNPRPTKCPVKPHKKPCYINCKARC